MNLQDIAKEVLEVLGTGRQLDLSPRSIPTLHLRMLITLRPRFAQREKRGASVPSAARSVSPTGPYGLNTASMRQSGAMSTMARSARSPASRSRLR